MADDRTLTYAEALFNVARAEGTLADVEDDLFRFSQTLQGSDELREALTDPAIPVARRQQIVEDLLGGKASPTTVALVSLVVGTGRTRELPAIIRELVEMSAAEANKAVAEVRSAIPLNQDQRDRLAKALGEATGHEVALKVLIDPAVKGGIVAQVGDTVIDGSVRTKLERLRKAL
jgi:F-type H+-transporting ATPase subunit delta